MSENRNSKETLYTVLTLAGVALVGILLVITIKWLYGLSVYDRAVDLKNQVERAYSDIEVQEVKRTTTVTKIVEIIESYDAYEASTLEKVIDARVREGSTSIGTEISVVVESYPELKSNENYKTLMQELTISENSIAEHRKAYNANVASYNAYIEKSLHRGVLISKGFDITKIETLKFAEEARELPDKLFSE